MKIKEISTRVDIKVSFNWNSIAISNGATAEISEGESSVECLKSLFQRLRKLSELEVNKWYESIHKELEDFK